MKHGGKIAFCLAGGLAWHVTAGAVTSDDGKLNPYSAIVDRNVFNLKPVPPPPTGPVKPEDQPTKITLLGIVSGFGPKQVMFKSPVGTPPKETSFALGVGEGAEGFEVLEINEVAGSVRIKNRGQEEALTLEKHGMKPTASAPVSPTPGLPGAPRIPVPPVPGAPPGQPTTSGISAQTGGSAVTTFGGNTPTRPLRVSTSGTPGLVGTTSRTTTTQAQPQQPNLTPEEQVVLMEINRAKYKKEVEQGLMPPLPPTPFTPSESSPK